MHIVHKIIFNNTVELCQKVFKNKIIKSYFDPEKTAPVLDVGIGSGVAAQVIKKIYPNIRVKGLDIHNMLWRENSDIPITLYDGVHFPFKNDAFDSALIFFVLHHAEHPAVVLSETKRVVKRYILVIEELNRHKIQNIAMVLYDLLINFIVFGHFIQTPHFKSDEQLRRLFVKAGLIVREQHIIKRGVLVTRVAYLLDKAD